jgi:hypothetical protein
LSELGFGISNSAREGAKDRGIVAITRIVGDPDDRLVDHQWAEESEVIGMVGRGIARAAVIGERVNSPEPPEPRIAARVAGAAVKRIASLGSGSQSIAAVAISQMISQAKPLETRVESRWAVPERADARATAAAVIIDGTLLDLRAHDCGLTAVGQGRRGKEDPAQQRHAGRLTGKWATSLCQ